MARKTGSPEYMAKDYMAYQEKYRRTMRESDKALIGFLAATADDVGPGSLLDIGCHNGNLLFHLRHAFPRLELSGADIFPQVIEACRDDPELSGIDFHVLDILNLPRKPKYDYVVANAVLFRFDDAEYRTSIAGIASQLKPGGCFIGFEWYHGFRQTLRIVEETPHHPEGLVIHARSRFDVAGVFKDCGFTEVAFHPFDIPIDLPLADPADALHTHTRLTAEGNRLQFRGALHQPWCHVVARL